MNVEHSRLAGVRIIEPAVHGDDRGFFMESWNARSYREAGIDCEFVQDNISRSRRGVLRGLHYQIASVQAKLVWVHAGEVYDVIVDLRRSSPTFGQWEGNYLGGGDKRRLLVPRGCAHGFLVVSESADFCYKCDNYYAPEHERSLLWNDPALAIEWPLAGIGEPAVSAKDAAAAGFGDCEKFD